MASSARKGMRGFPFSGGRRIPAERLRRIHQRTRLNIVDPPPAEKLAVLANRRRRGFRVCEEEVVHEGEQSLRLRECGGDA